MTETTAITINLPHLSLVDKDQLPHCSAVYFVFDGSQVLQYIGSTLDLHQRWTHHHRDKHFSRLDGAIIRWKKVKAEDRKALERKLIRELKPVQNNTLLDGRSKRRMSCFEKTQAFWKAECVKQGVKHVHELVYAEGEEPNV